MISVIIPTYNRAHLIDKTLDSILKQSYKDWECIIIDDYSTDNTHEVVKAYLDKDKRFQFYIKPKHLSKGPSSSRNYGFTKAKGEYINWLDSDDLMHPDKMALDMEALISSNCDFTISQSKFFCKDNAMLVKEFWNPNLWSKDPINDFILKNIGWSVNSPLWVVESLEKKTISFKECLMTGDDYLYHIEALQNQLKPYIHDKVLISLRQHPDRLNEYKLKAPSKLIVNNTMIEQLFCTHLNQQSIEFLNQQTYKQVMNLLKKRKFLLYLKFFFKTLGLNYNVKTKLKLISKLPAGLFFLFTNRGYKFLN